MSLAQNWIIRPALMFALAVVLRMPLDAMRIAIPLVLHSSSSSCRVLPWAG